MIKTNYGRKLIWDKLLIWHFFIFQELHEKNEGEIGAPDPLDVDHKKVTDNLNNMQQQQTTQYGSIPNGTAATEGNNHKIKFGTKL